MLIPLGPGAACSGDNNKLPPTAVVIMPSLSLDIEMSYISVPFGAKVTTAFEDKESILHNTR